jgi:hypothetical protein
MLAVANKSLYENRIGAVERINHSNNYELKKDGHSAFYDHSEPVENALEDFSDYFIEAQQMLVKMN